MLRNVDSWTVSESQCCQASWLCLRQGTDHDVHLQDIAAIQSGCLCADSTNANGLLLMLGPQAAYCLVYELMDGSLDTRLAQGSTPLPWQHRIDVAMQAAAGLAFLHRVCESSSPVFSCRIHWLTRYVTSCSLMGCGYDKTYSHLDLQGTSFPLAHMDVKSANVLLRGTQTHQASRPLP